ncbi:MAG: hypothetical protein IPN22_10740 [Bacteroidetes bacterium]|nr:hypothetical protein [Bacteroidota bacterium]
MLITVSNGSELWVTDGTTAGTQMVKNINPSGSSNPENFTLFNNQLFFSADDNQLGRTLGDGNDGTKW